MCQLILSRVQQELRVSLPFRKDKEYEQCYLKAEIARRLLHEYPTLENNDVKRNEIQDHIIDIVKKANREKRKLLTFVDITNTTTTVNDFHKIILSTLLQCETPKFWFLPLAFDFLFSAKIERKHV